MNNFFLLNEAIDIKDFNAFKMGLSELVVLEKADDDLMMKHESVYSLAIMNDLYSNFGYDEQIISTFIEQLSSTPDYIEDEVVFDTIYPNDANGFLGIDFTGVLISELKQITDSRSFASFKNRNLWDISFRNVRSKRALLFSNLTLCGEVEAQISKIGDSSFLNQIVDRLRSLDEAVAVWKKESGDFSYKSVNRNYPLRISPESDQTMSKYGNERLFSLPNGKRVHFVLHIKTGELRFHFYADNIERNVYVGYIGPHLSIVS